MLSQIERPVIVSSPIVPLQLQPVGHDVVNNVDLYVGGQTLYVYQNEPEDQLIGSFPLNAQFIQFLAPIEQEHPTISGVYCHECRQMVAAPQVQQHPCKEMSAS